MGRLSGGVLLCDLFAAAGMRVGGNANASGAYGGGWSRIR